MPVPSKRKCAAPDCCKNLAYGNSSGFCQTHYWHSRRQVPQGRIVDYTWLRSRGMSKDEAVAHLKAGLPCIRPTRVPTYGHKKISVLSALNLASDAMEVCARDVLSDCRFAFVVDCRAVVVRIMSEQGMAYTEIGRRLKRDHTSIKHLNDTFHKRAAKRPVLAKVVNDILELAA